jgi:phytanoyl-CoA dioxygenase PhyH
MSAAIARRRVGWLRSLVLGARSVLLAPVWVAQLLTGAKSFLDNPLIGSRRLNAHGLHAWRLRAADRLAWWRRRRLAALVGAEERAEFDRNGYVVRRDFLPAPLFAALLEQVKSYRVMAREQLQGDALTRRIACDRAALKAMPALAALLADPRWRGLIHYAGSFDAQPLVYLQSVLSHACAGQADPQEALHSDAFHATVKAWLFLTDVERDGACFTYVAGSHRLTPGRLAWEQAQSVRLCSAGDRLSRRGSLRVAPEELAGIGLPPPEQIAAPANTLVVADTRGFHARGASRSPTLRVEVWAYGRRNPFLPLTGLDPWGTALLRHRQVTLFWRAGDVLERAGLKPQVWRPVPNRGVFDRAARRDPATEG